MTTILFFVVLWMICKGIKALFRPRHKANNSAVYSDDTKRFYADIDDMIEKYRAESETETSRVTRSLAALEALQAQRDLINEQIRDIEEQLDYCPPEKVRNQYMSKKTALLGKLAVCESKISRLCGA